MLGATLLVEEHDDLVAAGRRGSRERGTTYIMVGESEPPRGLARLREPLPQRLMRATPPGVDVRIVAHRGSSRRTSDDRARPRRRWRCWLAARRPASCSPRSRWRGGAPRGAEPVHRILLPFTGTEISRRALDAALRLARAEDATLMPAYLAAVPLQLPLDCAIPARRGRAMPMLEAIEQRASAQGVPVDARIERGRSYRHALQRLLERETFDRVVVPADATAATDSRGDDLVWLLEKAPAEVLILRPAPGVRSAPLPQIRRARATPAVKIL